MSRFRIIHLLPLVIIFLLIISCSRTNYQVMKINETSTPTSSPGFYYALPRNTISIDITVTKTKVIAGPYAKYASKYLGIKNVNESNSVYYEITDVKMNVFAEPDPENFYFVDLSKYKSSARHPLMIRLSESGILQDVNNISDAKVNAELRHYLEKADIDYSETFKILASDNLKEQFDTVVEKLTTDTMIIEKTVVKRSLVEKTMEEKAKEAADFIATVKEQRLDIITGAQEVAYTDATLRLMNEELNKLEKEYMTLFTGATETQTYQYRYTYTPESQIFNAQIPLFKFSKYVGVVNENFEGGQTVYIKVSRAKNTMPLSNYITAKENIEVKKTSNGFYYRIPEFAKFSVMNGIDQVAEASFLISQFGVLTILPAGDANIQFYPNTGAIQKIEFK